MVFRRIIASGTQFLFANRSEVVKSSCHATADLLITGHLKAGRSPWSAGRFFHSLLNAPRIVAALAARERINDN